MKKLIGHPSISALGERLISHGGNMLVNIKKKLIEDGKMEVVVEMACE